MTAFFSVRLDDETVPPMPDPEQRDASHSPKASAQNTTESPISEDRFFIFSVSLEVAFIH